MPCYQVRTMSVEFQAKHLDILTEALTSLDWNWRVVGHEIVIPGRGVTLNLETQQAEIEVGVGQGNLNRIKQAYSEKALERVARLKMWNKKSTGHNKGVLRRF